MTATQCPQRLHPSFRVDPRGQGSGKRRSLWAEFPNSGLKAQAGSLPSDPGAAGPVLSNSLSFCRCEGKSSVSCCPWDLRCPIEKKLHFHKRYGFPGGSEVKASACNVGDLGSIPGLGRSPGEGNGNPLQYPCLENLMDRGAWWAAVYGVIESRARLSNYHFLTQGTV